MTSSRLLVPVVFEIESMLDVRARDRATVVPAPAAPSDPSIGHHDL